jgi:LL-diaminopimelate aminotransferase
MKTAANRLDNLALYPFACWERKINALYKRQEDIIRLDIGNPDLPPPDAAINKLSRSACLTSTHGYAGYRGISPLREEISSYYKHRFDVDLDPETQIAPLLGSKEGIVNLSLALLDPGDTAIVPDPSYPSYAMGASLAGASIYSVPLLPENVFLPDLDSVPSEIADKAAIMWLNYPNNPTSAVASLAFFEKAIGFAKSHDILLCHDAPYCDILYDTPKSPSILQVPGADKVAVEFNSLSKTYNMAGWRVGMAVGNAAVISSLFRVKSNVDSGLFLPIQEAAIVALRTPRTWVESRNKIYKQRMYAAMRGLKSIGLSAFQPKATLYIWVEVPSEWSSEAFADFLLEKAAVAVTPGSFFGKHGQGYIRISLTCCQERIEEGMDRIAKIIS